MPVVPFTSRPNQSQPLPKIDPTFLMMAAAELHEAGRLVEPLDSGAVRQATLPKSIPKDQT